MIEISLSNLIERLSNLVKNSIKMSQKNDKISCFRRLSPFRVEIGNTKGSRFELPNIPHLSDKLWTHYFLCTSCNRPSKISCEH